MLTQQIRRQFLNYFKQKQHSIIPSSSVVPHDDPTLLFINAGMNQFKDVFLGESQRDYTRASTSQKCIRVGGKHNDLENVGHTRRHLTFFEMLGNFSFGDYFKAEAIQFAWEVSTQVFGFEPERIWPTVFLDDDEAFELWTKYVPAERITRLGEESNFWAMGETGPCGPCSELLYDRGPNYGNATRPIDDVDGERFLEFWNLVFMQYNRYADGKLEKLPKPSIDTGAGLERIISLRMNVDSVFETDVLRSIISKIEEISGIHYHADNQAKAPAFRVIADHLRCLAFAIADGAQPSNVERGYVLRKILRRAVRYGKSLGFEEPFLAKILPRLIELMGPDYPEITKAQSRIAEILTAEEEAFFRTLRRGGNLLNQIMERARAHGKEIAGDDAFKLKDTYGLPIEEILLLAKDAGLSVDLSRYQALEEEAKERSRGVHKTTQQLASENLFANYETKNGPCKFLGYDQTSSTGKVTALLVNGQLVDEMREGDEGMVVLNQTPFYAEMGGQVGDTGTLRGTHQFFRVSDCQPPFKNVIGHIGVLEKGKIHLGDTLDASIDFDRRQKIANNHTATHLLHWALQIVLGEHVKQAGSVVDPERLRFDFSHHKALTTEEIRRIEDMVNEKIRENRHVKWYEVNYEDVQRHSEIKQFFGEKYGNVVRVVDIDFSKELCGGTHVSAVGNIGYFRIEKEGSIAAGVRRIEAVTGKEAEAIARDSDILLDQLSQLLKTQPPKLVERLTKLLEENKDFSNQIKLAKKSQLDGVVNSLLSKVETIKGIPYLISELSLNPEELKICADELSQKLSSGVLILGTAFDGRGQLIVRVTDDLVPKGLSAQTLVKELAPIIEGSGGGKPNSAQAGGKAGHRIGEAIKRARSLANE